MMEEYTVKPEITASMAYLSKIAAVQRDMTPAMRALNEITKQCESYKIDIPPAVTELQQKLSELKFEPLTVGSKEKQDIEGKADEQNEI